MMTTRVCAQEAAGQAPPAQPQILWQSCTGGNGQDKAKAFLNTSDGAFLIVGKTRSSVIEGTSRALDSDVPRIDEDILAVKMNAKGRVLWRKLYGGTYAESAEDVIAVKEGGFLIVGHTNSKAYTNGERDMFVVRIDKLGKELWAMSFGGEGNDVARSAVELPNGDFIIAGETGSGGGDVTYNRGGIDAWAIRIDPNGNLIWEKNYGGRAPDNFQKVVMADDNSVIFLGSTESKDGDATANHGRTDVFVVKTHLNNGLIWRKCFGGSENDEAYDLVRTPSNDFLLAGTTFSSDGDVDTLRGLGDVWVVHFSTRGVINWEKTYGGSRSEGANGISRSFDGNYLVCGTTSSNDSQVGHYYGKFDGWIMKISAQGDFIWERAMGGGSKEEFHDVKEAPSGDYVVCGYTNSYGNDLVGVQREQGNDFWMAGLTDPDDPQNTKSLAPTVIMGYVKDSLTGKYIEAEIALMDNKTASTIYKSESDTAYGIYQLIVPDELELSVGAYAQGYVFKHKQLFITPNERYGEIRLDWELMPLLKDREQKLTFFNIHFEIGKAALLDDSKVELNKIAQFLQKNPQLDVRVEGHTDSTGGNAAAKVELATRRANMVRLYLAGQGVDRDRITTKGWGMQKPLGPEDTDEKRRRNRRVEFFFSEPTGE